MIRHNDVTNIIQTSMTSQLPYNLSYKNKTKTVSWRYRLTYNLAYTTMIYDVKRHDVTKKNIFMTSNVMTSPRRLYMTSYVMTSKEDYLWCHTSWRHQEDYLWRHSLWRHQEDHVSESSSCDGRRQGLLLGSP